MRLRSGLCDGHSNPLTLLSLSHFAQLWKNAWGHCPFGRPICDQALTSWLISWDVASIYPHTFPASHNFPSSWRHLFCEVHQSLLQQSTPTAWCCQPRASQLGWFSLACKPPPFASKRNDGYYGQTVLFLFHQTRGHFKYDFCPHMQLQTVVWLFYGGFRAVASSLLSGLSGYVDIWLVFLWIQILLYLFPPTSSQGPLLLFWVLFCVHL